MSSIDLDELRILLAATTPGPWASRPTSTQEGELLEDIIAKGSGNLTVASECEERDADLITAAVNALPGLLDALVKARTERDEARKAYMELMAERNQIHAERDEARQAFEHEKMARYGREMTAMEDADEARRERDEAQVEWVWSGFHFHGRHRDERDEAYRESADQRALVRVAEAVRDACAAACYNDSYDAVVAVDLPAIIRVAAPSSEKSK